MKNNATFTNFRIPEPKTFIKKYTLNQFESKKFDFFQKTANDIEYYLTRDLILVRRNMKYGVIDEKCNIILPLTYENSRECLIDIKKIINKSKQKSK